MTKKPTTKTCTPFSPFREGVNAHDPGFCGANLPFGELFISQRNDGFDSRYKFTAKELDNETNYTYFGARYYDSDVSIWLSVDPMADKYPSMSPFMYCAGNPVILVDPDGQRITFGFLAFKSRHLFNRVYRSADAETRAKYDALKSSNVNYRINMTNLSDRAGGTTYNFAKDRVDVNINPNSSNMVGTIGDELETAYQYQVGDIGFVLNNAGVVGSLGYDMNDEVATKRAEIKATGAVNSFEGINIQLDKTTEAFKQADTGPITPGLTRDQMIENYFISDPSASQYLNQFQPGIKGVHTGGANMKNRISGTGGYTLQQLNDFKNNGAIKDFKYNGE